ncbi:hypothetical protein ATPR_0465 [Acetobacter tropicalis NBRC 101654]|uniref:Uncharacterized protein n=1 Tax=Acetobacter tropicalis NBRC 101654 TaxID=749388 RepID=F7VAR6_9PROT|nr:hypothetical protein ATPR_0465 [Acetobacter tropicalis NBRC 101654]
MTLFFYKREDRLDDILRVRGQEQLFLCPIFYFVYFLD